MTQTIDNIIKHYPSSERTTNHYVALYAELERRGVVPKEIAPLVNAIENSARLDGYKIAHRAMQRR